MVRFLVAAGAPLDHVNDLCRTALLEAVILGDGGTDFVGTLRALIDAGVDRTIPDRDGVTPLAHARARGFTEIAETLL